MPQYATRKQIVAVTPLVAFLFVNGVVFVVTGVLFAVWPASLAEAGFMANPSAPRRMALLLFFGGVGAACLHGVHALITSGPSWGRRVTSIATTIAVAAIGLIWRNPDYRWVGWVALIASVSSLLLFRYVGHDQSPDSSA